MIIPVFLGFYLFVCISVVLFNCWKSLSGLWIRWRFAWNKRRFQRWFWRGGSQYTMLTDWQQYQLVRRMGRRLGSNGRMQAFHAAMDELESQHPELLARCMPLMAAIIRQAFPDYADRSAMKQAYYSFLVTRFQVMRYAPSERLTAYLLEQIRAEKSLYNLENALRAVYSSGQVSLVLEALKALDGATQIFLHEKLLVEGLLTFPRRNELIAALWEHFAHYGKEMQELLLDYIRFASGAWKEPMLRLAQTTGDLEIRIACLRYFARYPDERLRPMLYTIARQSDEAEWELRAVCMTVLASYPGGETIFLLKEGLRSRNWYVRYNAALSLRSLQVSEADVQDVLTGSDRYAKEMLQYRLGLGGAALEGETV